MNDEKIDILLATYNGELYLEEQIESILNQSYENFNLIISDDSSSDNTRSIIKKYSKLDKRISYYFQDKNLGYVGNFEFLINNSKSNYIMFSDQDDYWLENKIEKTFNYLKEKDLDLVYTDLVVVDKNLNVIYPSMIRNMKKIYQTKFNDYRSFILDNVATGCTMLFKREAIIDSLPIPKSFFVHDWWISLITSINHKVGYLDEQLILYRQHDSNSIGIKSTLSADFEKYRNNFFKFHSDEFKEYYTNIDRFDKKYHRYIKTGYDFFCKKKHGIKNFMLLYIRMGIRRIGSTFLLIYLPCIYKLLFNMKRR